MPTKDPREIAGFVCLIKFEDKATGRMKLIQGPPLTEAEVHIMESFIERLSQEEILPWPAGVSILERLKLTN